MNTTLSARFHSAIINGNLESVRSQIDEGAAVNACNAEKETPLHFAVEKGNEDIVRLLLKKGALPSPDISNFEPLHIACFQRSMSIAQLLLNARTQLEVSSREPLLIALVIAAQEDAIQIVSWMLSAGINPNVYLQSPLCHHRLPFSVCCGSAPLHLACERGNLGIVKLLLEYKAKNDCSRHVDGYHPIHVAAENDHVEVVSYLLRSGVDPNVEANDNLTPLHLAAKEGCEEVVEALLDNNANVHSRTSEGLTPLILAVKNEQKEVAEILLDHGACVNDRDENNDMPLCYAVEKGNYFLVKCLLHYEPEISVKVKESIGEIILKGRYWFCRSKVVDAFVDYGFMVNPEDSQFLLPAVKTGYTKVVKYLLENGADPNENDLLHHAVENEHIEIIRLLLEAGCNINAKDESGKTPIQYLLCQYRCAKHVATTQLLVQSGANLKDVPELLHNAVKRQSIDLCRFLIKIGVDVNGLDRSGRVPLHQTAPVMGNEYGSGWDHDSSSEDEDTEEIRPEVARILLNNGANVDAKANNGLTTLQMAAIFGWSEVARVLLEFKANVNVTDKKFYTPLHMAAKKGHKYIVKSLLANGAEIDTPLGGDGGLTPLHIAAHKGHAKVVKVLLQFDANINVQDSGGNTPLHCAIRRNRREVVTVLLENDCDVNIKGTSGNTALGLALENFVDSDSDFPYFSCDEDFYDPEYYPYEEEYEDHKIFKTISKAVRNHVLKLRAAGLFISKWNEHLIVWAYDNDDKELVQFNRKCEKEVERMKENMLCNHMTLFSVLVNHTNPAFVRNDSAIRALKSMDLSKYPIYGSLLLSRSKIARRMHALLGPGTKCLGILLKTRNVLNHEQLPTLPVELLEKIVLFLNKTDIKHLISCGEKLKSQLSK